MTGEKRKSQRQTLKYPAKIDVASGDVPINCVLTDVSASGVRLTVESPDQVPEYFELVLAPDQVMRRCKVIWRDGNVVGAEFMKAGAFKTAQRRLVNTGAPVT